MTRLADLLMSWASHRIDRIDRLAFVHLSADSWRGADEVSAVWPLLELSADIGGVVVLLDPISAAEWAPAGRVHARQLGLGPKTNGLLKPLGVAVAGAVRDEALQIVAEADVVVATPEASFADTSALRGEFAVHAQALSTVLPQPEVLRLALGGESTAMTAQRAAALGLVDDIVPTTKLREEVARRVTALLSPQPDTGTRDD